MAPSKISLPDSLDLGDSIMTFQVRDGIHYNITRWAGAPSAPSAPFLVPPHWHDLHDERITVLEGVMDIYQNGVWERVVADPEREIAIPRGVVH